MKRALLILIPSFIFAGLIFVLVQSFILRGKDKGALQVTAAPQSKVYLNGKYLGTTPLCKCDANDMLTVGDYTIRLVPTSGNFNEFQAKITLSKSILTVVDRKFGVGADSEGSIITLQPLQNSDKPQLLITSIPDKAEVFLDNSSSGFTPLLLQNLTDSDHELTLKKSGYADKKIRIRTPSGYKLIAAVYLGIDEEGLPSLTPTPTTVASPSATPTPVVIEKVLILDTPTGFLRVRQSANVSSAQVGEVKPGQAFPLIDENDGWYEIQLEDGSKGWVSDQYAKKQ
ncbi:MAG TPA: PEGA domain-containing protein [Patescibacteria group bacterium]|nr:PEGA domain-containing protein [Patescibacteria group bacterium]